MSKPGLSLVRTKPPGLHHLRKNAPATVVKPDHRQVSTNRKEALDGWEDEGGSLGKPLSLRPKDRPLPR
jgi:hypothetical protein